MPDRPGRGLSSEELGAQQAADLPEREAMSLLDLNADLNLALDLAAPVDAAIAANANVAAPIDAAVGANIASNGAVAMANANQDSTITQVLQGDATAVSNQDAAVDQSGN
jgi:hypothetical protein